MAHEYTLSEVNKYKKPTSWLPTKQQKSNYMANIMGTEFTRKS
jgi:hypothetical protein